MNELFVIIVSTVLVNNFVLVKFLGLCPFMGVTRKLETAIGMSLATTFVLTVASALSYLVHAWLLVPLQVEFLRIISFIMVIAVAVQITEITVRRSNPILYQLLGIYLPLITTNSAILGVTLLNVTSSRSFLQSIVFGFGTAV
ncbi:MAG: Rnf-Nqr domain containing protein, partial [Pseudomonadota bacterium]